MQEKQRHHAVQKSECYVFKEKANPPGHRGPLTQILYRFLRKADPETIGN